jgi:hypothetical protein
MPTNVTDNPYWKYNVGSCGDVNSQLEEDVTNSVFFTSTLENTCFCMLSRSKRNKQSTKVHFSAVNCLHLYSGMHSGRFLHLWLWWYRSRNAVRPRHQNNCTVDLLLWKSLHLNKDKSPVTGQLYTLMGHEMRKDNLRPDWRKVEIIVGMPPATYHQPPICWLGTATCRPNFNEVVA